LLLDRDHLSTNSNKTKMILFNNLQIGAYFEILAQNHLSNCMSIFYKIGDPDMGDINRYTSKNSNKLTYLLYNSPLPPRDHLFGIYLFYNLLLISKLVNLKVVRGWPRLNCKSFKINKNASGPSRDHLIFSSH
jgi:hypothetical protein